MLVKYKSNKQKESNGYFRNRVRLRFEFLERNGDTVKLQGKCENGTPWIEYAHIDEIKEK